MPPAHQIDHQIDRTLNFLNMKLMAIFFPRSLPNHMPSSRSAEYSELTVVSVMVGGSFRVRRRRRRLRLHWQAKPVVYSAQLFITSAVNHSHSVLVRTKSRGTNRQCAA
jgi:hypothetical protein